MKVGADVSKYSAEQLSWCRMYAAETGWPALMHEYEAGNETFYEAARKSIGWFESWASDALLRVTTLDPRSAANGGRGMKTLALIILAAMAPVFLMMWFDDLEARHERERGNQAAPKPEAKP